MNENNKDEKKNNCIMTFYYRQTLQNQSQTYLPNHTKKYNNLKVEKKMFCTY